jgi:aerobic carbon-monoxide dehydrogenase medium subunit
MLLREFEYERPGTIEEAVALLASREGARVLAGGQTLINVMKLRVVSPEIVVDVTRIPDLKAISVADDGSLEVGATATYDEINRSNEVLTLRPLVAEVAGVIADVQVRNRGTIGGNVCLNLPTSHFPPVTIALGATMVIVGPNGECRVSAEDFFITSFTTALKQGEILKAIRFPPRQLGQGDAFVAMSAGKESQSIVHAAASIRLDGRIEHARVALGCVAPAPLRVLRVEEALVGADARQEVAAEAVVGLGSALSPVGDVNASPDFKRHVAEVVARRAVERAIERAKAATA